MRKKRVLLIDPSYEEFYSKSEIDLEMNGELQKIFFMMKQQTFYHFVRQVVLDQV